jgi:hypothetical protein
VTTATELRYLAQQALLGNTAAGGNIFVPLDQPTWDREYPVMFLTTPKQGGPSFGNSKPMAYTVTATLRVEARASTPASANDGGATELLAELEAMRDQILGCVINYPPLLSLVQGMPRFDVTFPPGPDNTTDHMGSVVVEIDLEFVQGPHEFYRLIGTPLEGFDAAVQEPPGTVQPGFSITFPPFIQS